jgi:hypothetical protein
MAISFDPEKSLFELYVVRMIVALASIIFVTLSAIIGFKSAATWDFSACGFNTAFAMFKVPLGVLAVGLSLIGLCGANHRSEQTKRQIERTATQIALTKSQNDFANFYKHIEEFEKYCLKITDENFSVKSTRDLYRKIYPDSRSGYFSTSPQIVANLQNLVDDFLIHLHNIAERNAPQKSLLELIDQRNEVLQKFRISHDVSKNAQSMADIKGKNYTIFTKYFAHFIKQYTEMFLFIDKILHFDVNYRSPDIFQSLGKIDVSNLEGLIVNVYEPYPFDFSAVFGVLGVSHIDGLKKLQAERRELGLESYVANENS